MLQNQDSLAVSDGYAKLVWSDYCLGALSAMQRPGPSGQRVLDGNLA